MTGKLVLASASPFRSAMLARAGVDFTAEKPDLDERAAEAPLLETDASPDDVASVLAEAKAMSVAAHNPGAFVIGCDQTLSIDDRILHKAADMEAARRQLLSLAGRTHRLDTAAVIVKDGGTLWRHVESAHLTMRKLTPAQIGRYLSDVGDDALRSVGCYQIEGPGIRLFEKVEGDFFSIVGLPLLPLLGALRDLGAIDG